jgi:hypothetical protein
MITLFDSASARVAARRGAGNSRLEVLYAMQPRWPPQESAATRCAPSKHSSFDSLSNVSLIRCVSPLLILDIELELRLRLRCVHRFMPRVCRAFAAIVEAKEIESPTLFNNID